MPEDHPILSADPRAGFLARRREIEKAVQDFFETGRYILGPEVDAFEREFAAYIGVDHVVGVASGTDAIELALRAAGVGEGDGVIVPALTVTATAAAVERAGAVPVLADIEENGFNLDPEAAEEAATLSEIPVKAILPVHLYGHAADLDRLGALAASRGMVLIEDCAQAHGARIGERRVGSIGFAGAFSFYPTKNLGGFGDGGAVATSDAGLAERVRELRQYGWRERYVSAIPGMNSRLDGIQAAILSVKLRHLDEDNARRRELAAVYTERLADSPVRLPVGAAESEPVWHQYVIRTPNRDGLRAHLAAKNIHAAVLYPVPLHRQPAYRRYDPTSSRSLARSEQACDELLCLPIFPEMTDAQAHAVADAVLKFEGS